MGPLASDCGGFFFNPPVKILISKYKPAKSKEMRSVQYIFPADTVKLGKSDILQALPIKSVEQVSPFLLLHHYKRTNIPAGEVDFSVSPHPHRGFEPVTFLFEGELHHRDSRGNEGFLKAGDVQWMTAGMGIVHSEEVTKEFLQRGGNLQLVQLWVNLSKKDKMTTPRYQDIKSETIPVYHSEDKQLSIRVIAGEWNGVTGVAETFTPVNALHVKVKKDKYDEFQIPADHNAMLYVLEGFVEINGKHHAKEGCIVLYKKEGTFISVKGLEDSAFLLLSGAPIEEPLASYGPFVMNTQTEIMEAVRDYQAGKMGILTY